MEMKVIDRRRNPDPWPECRELDPRPWLDYEDGMDEDEWVMANSMTEEEYDQMCLERDGIDLGDLND